jgi:2-hydroxychromene-2-carboxylate isomerase
MPWWTQQQEIPVSPAAIEFWFEFASNYSYLSVMRIEQAAARLGVTIQWRPFLLGPIFKALGWASSPFVVQTWKTEYVWRDMERECRKYGLAWTRPTTFPRAALLPARVALIGAEKPWMGEYCRRIMQLNFVADRNIDSAVNVSEVLAQLGLRAQEIIDEAQDEANKLRLRNQTELAQLKGIFGAPTFFVGEEMFWGNDRLDDALTYCRAPSIR